MRKHMITVGLASAALGGGLLAAPSALAQETSASGANRAVAPVAVQVDQSSTVHKDRPRYKRVCKIRFVKRYDGWRHKYVKRIQIRCFYVKRGGFYRY